ncbi:MAG: ankyrin repeat domain-containing protein [Alphaproteobacteria bacterium]|nr:ankyrin repeat domain-containing protein [Alphaproteobacteria bacterium]MDE2112226.1 ankyrin repeat domain-containing protein [Alphaproteobacteria bacterium]MDE2494158.1 ankyrin repeat domain-containing protein [Alphaproteobacteria bacterium]
MALAALFLLSAAARADETLDRELCAAIAKGAADDVRAVLAKGGNAGGTCVKPQIPGVPDSMLKTALFASYNAIDKRQAADIVETLIDAGADVNVKDVKGNPSLFRDMDVATAKVLLAHGADVNARDRVEGKVALDELPSALNVSGYTERTSAGIARLLIDHGADVNARDNAGLTPIYYAVDGCDVMLVSVLIAHGAKVDVAYKAGVDPSIGEEEIFWHSMDTVDEHLVESGRILTLLDVLKFTVSPCQKTQRRKIENILHTHGVGRKK